MELMDFRRGAFTLAETLITLVIIGIIAALVIPVTQRIVDDYVTVSRVKNAYAKFANAYKLMLDEEGTMDSWTWPSTNNWNSDNANYFLQVFQKYMKMGKVCYSATGCIAQGQTINYVSLSGLNSLGTMETGYAGKAITADGMTMSLTLGDTHCNYSSNTDWCGRLFFDINGPKKPNREGYDLFIFDITKYKISILIGPGTTASYNGPAVNPLYYKTYCNKTGASLTNYTDGMNCSTWIMLNNNTDYKYVDQ